MSDDTLLRLVAANASEIIIFDDRKFSVELMRDVADHLKRNTRLKQLSLNWNGLKPTYVVYIAQALKHNDSITSLLLGQNQIGSEGAIDLADSLRVNRSLLDLDLNSNGIAGDGGIALAKTLEVNDTLTSLVLDNNSISRVGGLAFAKALRVNRSLLNVQLMYNDIGLEASWSLKAVLTDNFHILSVQMFGNGATPHCMEQVEGILRRNRQLEEYAFHKALERDIKSPWRRSKLMLVGQGGVGKTATVRALLNEEFDPEWRSTVGVSLQESNTTRLNKWEKDPDNDKRTMFAERLAHKVVAEKTSLIESKGKSNRREALENFITDEKYNSMEFTHSDFDVKLAHIASVKNDGINVPVSAKESVYNYNKEMMVHSKRDPSSIRLSIWDYGGQRIFYTLHHLFLTKFGVYLVVFDAFKLCQTDPVESTITRRETDPAKPSPDIAVLSKKSSKTTLGRSEETPYNLEAIEYLRFWLWSIRLHAPGAPVILVSTFSDKLTDETRSSFFAKVESIITSQLHDFLQLIVPNRFLYFSPISNKTGYGLGTLRKNIEACINEQEYVNLEVSISWMRCLDDLLVRTERPWTLQEVVITAGKYKQRPSMVELNEMLRLFHQLGVLFWFDGSQPLREFVVTNPQWLIDAISLVIRDQVLHPFNEEEVLRCGLGNDVEALFTYGRASFDLLEFLWGKDRSMYLIELMQHLLLGSYWPLPDGEQLLLIPSMIVNIEEPMVELSVLCRVVFEFLPTGIFERLVCLGVGFNNSTQDNTTDTQPRLWKGRCLLFWTSNGITHPVFLEKRASTIRISVAQEAHANSTLQVISSMLKKIQRELMGSEFTWTVQVKQRDERFVNLNMAKQSPWAVKVAVPNEQLRLDEFLEHF